MKKLLQSLFVLLFVSMTVYAQEQTVTGTVISADDNLPIPGVSVKVKGTNSAVSTNASGKFTIKANAGSILVFSSIGFAEQERTVGSSPINVTLSTSSKQLQEVIVSGVAGATTKEKMTVSVTKVSAEQLTAVPPTSLTSALTGKVAGLKATSYGGMPGESLDIQLRADNNLNTSAAPLIIVDGVIITGSLADINADDVESMEVVKGAAASALYGSRAGNGVISIITKRGKGLQQNNVAITIRNEAGFQNIAKELKTANAHPYKLASDWEAFKGKYTKYDGVTYPANYVGAGYSPGIAGNRAIDTDHYLDNPYGVTYNQQDKFFVTGKNYTNFVSVANRSEKNNVYASFENNSQEGVIALTNGYKRQNFRLNLDQQVTSWLKFSMSNLYILRNVQFPGTINGGDVLNASNGGGIFYSIARQEKDVNLGGVNPDGQPYYLRSNHFNQEATNPLYDLYKRKRNERTNRWLGNYAINVGLTKWANVDVAHSIETENYKYTIVSPKDFWTQSGGTPATNGMSYTDGSMSITNSKFNNQNTQVTINLTGKLSENLTAKGKLSYLYENRRSEYNYTSASKFKISGVENLNNFETINSAGSNEQTEKAQNYFAIVGLDFKDKILLDGMFRYDGSSLFGSESRWNPYYRVSAAYRISQDVKINGIDELKIRAARGTAGIRPGFDWQYEVYSLANGNAAPSQKGNTFLKPSKTTENEIGLNVNFLKKFSFEATYASSKTEDQFLNVPLIPFLNDGFPNQWQNAGTVKSKTFEFSIGANWVRNSNFSWNTNVVFSKISQKIASLPIAPYVFADGALGDQSMFYIKEGESYGSMYGYKFVRTLDEISRQLPAGKTVANYEVNSDGYVIPKGSQGTPAELPVRLQENGADWYGKIGDGNPNFNMGISNTFTYKGITLYVLLDWKNGGDVYNGKEQRLAFNYVSERMDMTNVPAGQKKAYDYWSVGMYDKNDANAYWVEDGSYLKVREIALGYSFTKQTLQNLLNTNVIKGANFRVMGRNLLTFTKYSGYDPEVGSIRVPYDGIYANPNYRNFSFSLTLDF